uniref:RNA-directed RNA polymerase n=1 Tax=Malassezia globosa associated totivirus 1 TaxID=3048756 RepID=A0A9Y0WSL7_9VIRU|nr:RNA-dependent RNA polymerase [Malassezia globosa associated totivirus 1]
MLAVHYSQLYGERMVGLVVTHEGLDYAYADLKLVSRFTPSIMSTVGALLAGNARCGLTPENHRDFYSVKYEPRYKAPPTEVLLAAIESTAEWDVSQITQVHHLYVTWHELRVVFAHISRSTDYTSRYRAALAMQLIREAHSKGIRNRVSINTHLVYVAVAPLFAIRILAWVWDVTRNPRDYMATLKREGTYPKQLQTMFRDDLAQVYELQVLRNREFDHVDWEKEVEHRTEPTLAPLDGATVYKHACKIFMQARRAGAKQRKQSWDEYWDMRWSHMPVGSVVSQYAEDLALKKSLPRDARVKAAWFAANVNRDQSYWLTRQPEIYASTSTKYEWGKVRALYGCDVTSFIHSDFAMGDCEDMLPPNFPVGSRANEAYVRNIIEKFNDGVPFCYDFDDFNSQHSSRNMEQVLKAWYAVFGADLTPDQQKSMEWTIAAMGHQYVRYNELDRLVKINGTLLSGWRLTSFMNTVLNRVYLIEAGIGEHAIYSLHNGDDVFATMPTVYDAVRVVRRGELLGVRAQLSKMNIGTIGEFLRVDNRAKVKTSAQYLSRAIATATHGRVESAPANDFRELVRSHDARAKAMIDRGAVKSHVDMIHSRLIHFSTSLFNQDSRVVRMMREADSLQGGFTNSRELRAERIIRKTTESQEITDNAFKPILPGIHDYVRWMVRKIKIPFEGSYVSNVFHKAVDALIRRKIRYEIVVETDQMMGLYLKIKGAWKRSAFVVPISQARSLGFVAVKQMDGLPNTPLRIAQGAPDPIAMLAALLS